MDRPVAAHRAGRPHTAWGGVVVGLALAVACETEVDPPVCADVGIDGCEAAPGCRLSLGRPAVVDEQTRWACWQPEPVPVACIPDFLAEQCDRGFLGAASPPDGACFLFDDSCIPEGWETCVDPPFEALCPDCASDVLPPYREPDRVWDEGRPKGLGRRLAVGDLDGDGSKDLIAVADFGVWVYAGDDGVREITTTDTAGARDLSVVVADLDGDGADDLAIGAPNAQQRGDGGRTGSVGVWWGPLPDDRLRLDAPDLRLDGGSPGEQFGADLSFADGTLRILAATGNAYGTDRGEIRAVVVDPKEIVVDAGELEVVWGPNQGAPLGGLRLVPSPDATFGLSGDRQLVRWTPGVAGRPDASWGLGADGEEVGGVQVVDLDGDGALDVVWGVPAGPGSVRVAFGPLPEGGGTVVEDVRLDGRCVADGLGTTVVVGPDGTLAVGASASGGANVAGIVRAPGWWTEGGLITDGGERLGAPRWKGSAWVGDWDGEGGDDVIVGGGVPAVWGALR